MDHVFEYVMEDLRREMMQHGLDPSTIESLVRQRCDELIQQRGYGTGHILGSGISTSIVSNPTNKRELALQAAELRQRENENQADSESKKPSRNDNEHDS